jgi:hypothetical protein
MKATIVVLLLATNSAFAHHMSYDPSDLASANLKQEGQLVTVRVVIGEPLRIFVVGREEAKFDFSELKLIVKRMNPYPSKVLSLTKTGDYFTAPEAMNIHGSTDLEIKTTVKNKEETFRFKLNNRQH